MVQAGQVVIEYGDLAQGLSLSAILSLPLLNILLTRGKRTIAFDDTDSFEETCGYLATADRRHFVHPLYAEPATAPAPCGHATSE